MNLNAAYATAVREMNAHARDFSYRRALICQKAALTAGKQTTIKMSRLARLNRKLALVVHGSI